MDWYQIYHLGIVGKDLEIQLDGTIFRGPISNVVFDRNGVSIELSWAARLNGSFWDYCPTFKNHFVGRDRGSGNPRKLMSERIEFDAGWQSVGDRGLIYLQKGANLLPEKVIGFPR